MLLFFYLIKAIDTYQIPIMLYATYKVCPSTDQVNEIYFGTNFSFGVEI